MYWIASYLDKFSIRAASAFTQFCIVCHVSLLGVIQINGEYEKSKCVFKCGWNLSVYVWHTDDLDKWPLFGTYIVYIITNLLISKTKYRLNVTAWKVYQNNNPVVRFSIKALCIHTEIALNLLGLDKPVYINLIT